MNPCSNTDFYIFALAVFGLTYLVRCTNGPFDIFLALRIKLGKRYKVDYEGYCNDGIDLDGSYIEGKIDKNDLPWKEEARVLNRTELQTYEYEPWYTKLIDCFWCVATWLAAGLLFLLYVCDMPFWVIYWLAAVGTAGTIFTLLENGKKQENKS